MEFVDDDLDEAVRELDLLRQRSREGWWRACPGQLEREARVHHMATRKALNELQSPKARRGTP